MFAPSPAAKKQSLGLLALVAGIGEIGHVTAMLRSEQDPANRLALVTALARMKGEKAEEVAALKELARLDK